MLVPRSVAFGSILILIGHPFSLCFCPKNQLLRICLACMTALLSLAVASLIGSVADAAETEGHEGYGLMCNCLGHAKTLKQ